MGITIHYTIIADRYEQVLRVLRIVEEEARAAGWSCEYARVRGRVEFLKSVVPGELADTEGAGFEEAVEWLRGWYREVEVGRGPPESPAAPPFAYVWRTSDGGYCYATPLFSRDDGEDVAEGFVVSSGVTEDFSLLFYRLGDYYVCDDFCKTQPFTVDEVETCVRFHAFICRVLKRVADEVRPWHMRVFDEAGFYDEGDLQRLLEAFEESSKLIWALAAMVQRVADEEGLQVRVAGRYEVKPYKSPGEPGLESGDDWRGVFRSPRQTRLDEFGGEH